MEFLFKNAKAVVAVVLPLLINMVMDLVNGTAPWPQSNQEWLRYVLSSVVIGLGVYGMPNTTKDPEIARHQSVTLKPGRHALPE
jgi:hypothetical protein